MLVGEDGNDRFVSAGDAMAFDELDNYCDAICSCGRVGDKLRRRAKSRILQQKSDGQCLTRCSRNFYKES